MSLYLVTGGAGFIGSNIAEKLVNLGEKVRVIDNLTTGNVYNMSAFRNKIDFRHIDIRNEEDVISALDDVDYVIHQAAIRSTAGSVEKPMETNNVNVNGTLNLLINCIDKGIKKFVYASTSSIYGDCKTFPQDESIPPDPISPYGVSKLAGEYYCRMFSQIYGLNTVSLRYFNVFGPRQNPESHYSSVIPAFIRQIMNHKPCIIDGDGKQERDFVFVDDVVDAVIAACKDKVPNGSFLNVASGRSYSIIDLAHMLSEMIGEDKGYVFALKRAGDVLKTYASIEKAKEILSYEPRTTFEDGLMKTVEWFRRKGIQ